MNPIMLNEKIKSCLPKECSDIQGHLVKQPVFIHQYQRADLMEKAEKTKEIVSWIRQDLPYKSFRFCIKVKYPERNYDVDGFIVASDKKYIVGFFEKDFFILVDLSDDIIAGGKFKHNFYEKGREVDPDNRIDHLEMIQFSILAVSKLIEDVMNPSNFTATVSPEPKGRSVEWVKNRSHVIIINKRHAANREGLKSGCVVEDDRTSDLKRMAHSRRAHYRILRSPYFKSRMGEKVFIRASWIGPEEWKDTSGNVYKIRL